jgi:hypothetical protein
MLLQAGADPWLTVCVHGFFIWWYFRTGFIQLPYEWAVFQSGLVCTGNLRRIYLLN